jgi:hypothetical protein
MREDDSTDREKHIKMICHQLKVYGCKAEQEDEKFLIEYYNVQNE